MRRSVQERAIQRAAHIKGVGPLAAYLGTTEANVRRWMRDGVEIPEDAFLRIVEIVLEDSFDLADLRLDWARVPVS